MPTGTGTLRGARRNARSLGGSCCRAGDTVRLLTRLRPRIGKQVQLVEEVVVVARARKRIRFRSSELSELHAKRGHYYHNAHGLYAGGWIRTLPFPFTAGAPITVEIELSFFNPLQAAVDVSSMQLVGGVVRAGRKTHGTASSSLSALSHSVRGLGIDGEYELKVEFP